MNQSGKRKSRKYRNYFRITAGDKLSIKRLHQEIKQECQVPLALIAEQDLVDLEMEGQ